MPDIINNIENESDENSFDRRLGERRIRERRISDRLYDGGERRCVDSDRRITILNRLNVEVTDRRSLN